MQPCANRKNSAPDPGLPYRLDLLKFDSDSASRVLADDPPGAVPSVPHGSAGTRPHRYHHGVRNLRHRVFSLRNCHVARAVLRAPEPCQW